MSDPVLKLGEHYVSDFLNIDETTSGALVNALLTDFPNFLKNDIL